MRREIIFVIAVFFIGGFFVAAKVLAASADIVINEIGAYATSTHEWVEIWNKGSEAVDLFGWTFWEANTNHRLIASTTDGVVSAGEYAAICQDETVFLADHPNFLGSVFDSSWGSLSEEGEEIGLKDAGGNFVERFVYVSAVNNSLERKDPYATDYSSANWQEHASGNSLGLLNSNFFVEQTLTPITTSTSSTIPTSQTASTFTTPPTTTNSEENSPINTSTENNYTTSTVTTTEYDEDDIVDTSTLKLLWSKIKINEIMINPERGYEWVELFNAGTSSVDLAGGVICDSRTSTSCVVTSTGEIIGAGEWLVFSWTGSKLNNDTDAVILKDFTGTIVDEINYGGAGLSASEKGQSLARKNDGVDNDSSIDWSVTTQTTVGAKNIIILPLVKVSGGGSANKQVVSETDKKIEEKTIVSATSTLSQNESVCMFVTGTPSIIITEIYPNPVGSDAEDEFVEIQNMASTTIDLLGWKLGDNVKNYSLRGKIGAGEFMVWKRKITGIALNNSSGEIVKLINCLGQTVAEVKYNKASEGKSFSLDENGKWQWSEEVTPGEENYILVEVEKLNGDWLNGEMVEDKQVKSKIVNSKQKKIISKKNNAVVSYSIEGIRYLEKDVGVKIKGTVSVLPGVLGKQYFYIFDGVAGVQVYMYSKMFPKLDIGDSVEIRGVVSEASGVKRVKVKSEKDIRILKKNNLITSLKIDLGNIEDNVGGALAQVSGEITAVKSNFMFVDDGAGEIKVYFKKGAMIDKKKFKMWENIQVTGVLEQYNNEWQIWPRGMGDLILLGKADDVVGDQMPVITSQNNQKQVAENYLAATAGGITTVLLALVARARGAAIGGVVRKVAGMVASVVKRG